MPLPAAPAAGTRATRSHRYIARYRGVPTFADSSKTDDGTFDDPVVREAAVSALGRYNGSRGRPEYPNAVFGARRAWELGPA